MKEEVDKLKQQIKEHDAKRKILVAQLKYYQDICEHPNMKRWVSGSYDGSTDAHSHCPDCDYHNIV